MVKVIKKDYPWTIIIEDKVSKNTGKQYQAISVAFTDVKNKDAKDPKEKYETKYFNLFDERDLLKLSSAAENAYQRLKYEREREKEIDKMNRQNQEEPQPAQAKPAAYDDLDDDIPFD